MLETAPTLGSVETSTRQKKILAKQSLEFNCRDNTFKKLFPEYVEMYEEKRKEEGATSASASTLATTSADPRNEHVFEVQGLLATAAGLVAILSIVLAMRFI